MKLEILYPETGNLFGDSSNVKYLRLCLPEAEVIQTGLKDEPSFIKDDIDFIYMGPMTEKNQERAIKKLAVYTDELAEQIDKGTHFLFTGNSFEILGKYIKTDEGELPALGILDMYSERRMSKRHNSLFLGEFKDMKITAFNSRFSHTYPSAELTGFAKVLRGVGLNESCPYEGICRNNFIGTYLLGPILILNPHFTVHLLRSLGSDCVPAFWVEALAAYEKRLAEFQDRKVSLD
jgi:CobQ-like glutamine amidotransferase family enzyme